MRHFKSEHYLPETINEYHGRTDAELYWRLLSLSLSWCFLEINILDKTDFCLFANPIFSFWSVVCFSSWSADPDCGLGNTVQTDTDTGSQSSSCCSKMSCFHGEAADLLQGLQQSCFVFCLSPDGDSALCIICRHWQTTPALINKAAPRGSAAHWLTHPTERAFLMPVGSPHGTGSL